MTQDADNIRKKYPDRIPIIVNKHHSSHVQEISQKKFLVPDDFTIGQFCFVIRRKIQLNESTALFIFINNNIPSHSKTLNELYETYKSKDGYLYCTYASENTFG